MVAQVILMDHVDWQDLRQAKMLAAVLAKQVAPGGRVIWRSAALCPPYARVIREAGFEVRARLGIRCSVGGWDRRPGPAQCCRACLQRGDGCLRQCNCHSARATCIIVKVGGGI